MIKCLSTVNFPTSPNDPAEEAWEDDLTVEMTALLISDTEYRDALQSDPIKLCRELIAFCRASGQRREELRQIIIDGNHSGTTFTSTLPIVQLLRDVETRWASTHNMCERFLILQEVSAIPRHLSVRWKPDLSRF